MTTVELSDSPEGPLVTSVSLSGPSKKLHAGGGDAGGSGEVGGGGGDSGGVGSIGGEGGCAGGDGAFGGGGDAGGRGGKNGGGLSGGGGCNCTKDTRPARLVEDRVPPFR